jgi:pyruvate/2-oxoglutarate dehydrogenase complex dihydrolipoamide acyltransferase (E2) component
MTAPYAPSDGAPPRNDPVSNQDRVEMYKAKMLTREFEEQVQRSYLAVGRKHDRVVAVHGAIMVRPGLELTLSNDHGLIDGRIAGAFLGNLAARIERGPWSGA